MLTMLTAFAGETNASRLLISGISNDNTVVLTLTNSFPVSEAQMIEAIHRFKPELVLAFGQKPSSDRLFIEKTARRDEQVLHSNVDLKQLQFSLSQYNISHVLSENAGNYLCNYVYYAGLNLISQENPAAKMVFIHVPGMKLFVDFPETKRWLTEFLTQITEDKNCATHG